MINTNYNKNKGIDSLLIVAIIGILIVAFSGCVSEEKPEAPVSEMEKDYKIITDMRGKEVKIPKNPKRVVAISNTFIEEVMIVFGVEDKLVGYGGCTERKNNSYNYTYKGANYTYTGASFPATALYPKIHELTYVGRPGKGINYETIASLNPDIILVREWGFTSDETSKKEIEMMERLGVPVVVIKDTLCYHDEPSIKTMYKEIEVLGEVFDKQNEAKNLVKRIDKEVQFIKQRTNDIPDNKKPKVLYFGLPGSFTEHKDSKSAVGNAEGIDTIDSIFLENIVNAKNAYNGTGHHVVLSAEQVLSLNPDVLILPTFHGHHPPSELKNEFFKNIWEMKAIKENRICSLPATGCRSTRLEAPIDLMIMAKCSYPERFEDINIGEWSKNYYKEIYGIDDNEVKKIKLAQQFYRLEIE